MNGQWEPARPEDLPPLGGGFVVAQVGWHAIVRFADRMETLGLTPPDAGLLRAVAADPGRTQQALAEQFQMPPSRMVGLLDRLEERGLVARRRDPADRRRNAVVCTPAGHTMLRRIRDEARAHHAEILHALDDDERTLFMGLLERMVDDLGLTPGIHPIYRQL